MSADGETQSLRGKVDDLRIHRRALADWELTDLFRNRPPEAPIPRNPSDGAVGVDPAHVIFTWRPAADPDGDEVKYCVGVKDGAGRSVFAGCSDLAFVKRTSFPLPVELVAGRKYLWHVNAVDNKDGWSEPGKWVTFTTAGPATRQ